MQLLRRGVGSQHQCTRRHTSAAIRRVPVTRALPRWDRASLTLRHGVHRPLGPILASPTKRRPRSEAARQYEDLPPARRRCSHLARRESRRTSDPATPAGSRHPRACHVDRRERQDPTLSPTEAAGPPLGPETASSSPVEPSATSYWVEKPHVIDVGSPFLGPIVLQWAEPRGIARTYGDPYT